MFLVRVLFISAVCPGVCTHASSRSLFSPLLSCPDSIGTHHQTRHHCTHYIRDLRLLGSVHAPCHRSRHRPSTLISDPSSPLGSSSPADASTIDTTMVTSVDKAPDFSLADRAFLPPTFAGSFVPRASRGAAMTSTASGSGTPSRLPPPPPAKTTTRRPAPLPTMSTRTSTASASTSTTTATTATTSTANTTVTSSTAMTSAAASTNSCGWHSSACSSTPPTSPGISDASGCHPHYFNDKRENEEERLAERARARSVDGHGLAPDSSMVYPRKGKLTKKRPASVAVNGHEAVSNEKERSRKSLESTPMTARRSVDGGYAVPSPSRARSILGIKIGSKEREKTKEGRLAGVAERTDRVEFLPPVRPPSPLWAGSSGMVRTNDFLLLICYVIIMLHRFWLQIPSPYSRLSLPSTSTAEMHFKEVNPTDALASLAFTGNTSALSSSALAALTSRLTHRASSEVLNTSAPSSPGGSSRKAKKNGKAADIPPWTAAFSVTPIEKGLKVVSDAEGGETALFDPYAEARKDGSGRKSKDEPARLRPSLSFLRPSHDARSSDKGKQKAVSQPGTVRESGAASASAVPRRMRSRRNGRRENSPNTLRRWTLAMADVPDEVLVQELEKLRMEGRGEGTPKEESKRGRGRRSRAATAEASENGHAEPWRANGGDEEWGSEFSGDEDQDPSPASSSSHSGSGSQPRAWSSLDDLEWKTARRALLCCRELVRTERNYQARLRQLLAGDTATPPPVLVRTYVPALLRASEALLARLEDDPSAWGVSAAFVAVEEEAEAAFVAWAGVVGEIFVDEAFEEERGARKASRNSSFSNLGDAVGRGMGKRSRSGASISQTFGPVRMESVYRRRGVSLYDEGGPASMVGYAASGTGGMGMFTAALGTGLAYGISPSAASTDAYALARPPQVQASGSAGTLSRTFSAWKKTPRRTVVGSSPTLAAHSPLSGSPGGASAFGGVEEREKEREREREREREKRPGVRELAILPVQRVMRYVLQYRGKSSLLSLVFWCEVADGDL